MPTIRPLNSVLQEKAITELNENPDNLLEEIASVRQWIKQQPKLGKYKVSDQFILNFLRSCKFNHGTFRRKFPNYLNMHQTYPEMFANRKVSDDTLDMMRSGTHLFLSTYMESDFSRIYISRYSALDVEQYPLYKSVQLLYMILEINLFEDDHSVIGGYTAIQDLTGLSFSQMIVMNFRILKRILDLSTKGMPYRIKSLHIINAPWFANGLLRIGRALLPEKLKGRLFIHKTLDDLYAYVPQRLLPAEYGGELETVDDVTKIWEAKLQRYQNYFEYDLQFGTDSEDS